MSTYSFKIFSQARNAFVIGVTIQLVIMPSFFWTRANGFACCRESRSRYG